LFAFAGQGFRCFHGQFDFGAGGDDDGIGCALAVAQDVAAFADRVDLRLRTAHVRQVLPGEDQGAGAVLAFDGGFPAYGRFNRVARTPDLHVGDHAQGGGLFDRLVGRAVFAQTDGVVGVDEDGRGAFINAAMRRALRAYSLNIRKVAP